MIFAVVLFFIFFIPLIMRFAVVQSPLDEGRAFKWAVFNWLVNYTVLYWGYGIVNVFNLFAIITFIISYWIMAKIGKRREPDKSNLESEMQMIANSFRPIHFILMISLIANLIIFPRMILYQNYIDEELSSATNEILISIYDAQIIVQQVIDSQMINEHQFKEIYKGYDDFRDELNILVTFIYEFKDENRDLSNIHSAADLENQLQQFAIDKDLSFSKKLRDDVITINLNESEIDMFEHINRKSIEILACFDEEDYPAEYHITDEDWVKIIEGI